MRVGAVVTDQPIAFTVSTTKELLKLLQSARVAIAIDASNAILSRGLFDKARLPHSRFVCAKLQEASFRGADLSESDFTQANLVRVNLVKACLSGSCLAGVEADYARFGKADLDRVQASDARFCYGDFASTNLSALVADRSNCFQATFRGSNLQFSSFVEAALTNCSFDDCDLRQVNFSEANLTGSSFVNAQIEGADFTNAKLSDDQRETLKGIASGMNSATGRYTFASLEVGDERKDKRKLFGLI